MSVDFKVPLLFRPHFIWPKYLAIHPLCSQRGDLVDMANRVVCANRNQPTTAVVIKRPPFWNRNWLKNVSRNHTREVLPYQIRRQSVAAFGRYYDIIQIGGIRTYIYSPFKTRTKVHNLSLKFYPFVTNINYGLHDQTKRSRLYYIGQLRMVYKWFSGSLLLEMALFAQITLKSTSLVFKIIIY